MSDGSKEETVEKSTDELLAETDDLLGDLDGGDSPPRDAAGSPEASVDDASAVDGSLDDVGGTEPTATAATGTTDDRGFRKYFDPESAGVSAVLVLAGALLGGLVPIPIVGNLAGLLGVGAAAFLHGTAASDSRYAETLVAGAVVGFLVALVTNPLLSFTGIGVPLLAVSTVATVLVALVGHYFGRDLRAGLTKDVGGGGDDVPGW
jgi:hypothetical protein